jgi:hypothetical protein
MGESNPLKLRIKIDYTPGEDVFHPSLGYLFWDTDASKAIEKYHLTNGAGFDRIEELVKDMDFRNGLRPLKSLKYVRVIITQKGSQKAKVYDFDRRQILD